MGISHKHKFLSINIPRTASKSVNKAIGKGFDVDFSSKYAYDHPYHYHVTAQALKVHFENIGWEWSKYFKFSFVRNPWDRLVSYYFNFKPDKDLEYRWHMDMEKWQILKKSNLIGFNEWIERMRDVKFRPKLNHFEQISFLADNQGKLIVDYVGKFENLEPDFQEICNKIGIKSSLPWTNKNEHGDYKKQYTKKTVKIVEELFHRDIEKFQYSFGE